MKRALIGNGGHAYEVMMQIGEYLPCFVDDKLVDITSIPLSKFNPKEYEIMVAVGDPLTRHSIVSKLPPTTNYFSFIHPTALIGKDVEIGEGSFIGAYSILTTNIKIGKHAILNRGNQIGHDCRVGDYLSMMPGSIISGNVSIKDKVYIGTNSSIKEKIEICEQVIIGLNTGITKNITVPGKYIGAKTKMLNK